MNHPDTKTPRTIARGLVRQGARTRRTIHLYFLSLCLGALVAASANAQVASHKPVVVQPASESTVMPQTTGRPVVRVNGTILTDRDLLREMFTIFPYARVHNGFP